jgi:hypothetical protein
MSTRQNIRWAILLMLLLIPRRALRRPIAYMLLGAVLCFALIALGVAAHGATEESEELWSEYQPGFWPLLVAPGYWYCGDVEVRRTNEGINNHAAWVGFHVRISDGKFSPAPPRRIILTYDTKTERLTVNGKRCQFKKEEKEP